MKAKSSADSKGTLDTVMDPKLGRTDFHEEEVAAIRDILKNFECIICKGIPIKAHECSSCEVVYCKKCIENHRK